MTYKIAEKEALALFTGKLRIFWPPLHNILWKTGMKYSFDKDKKEYIVETW